MKGLFLLLALASWLQSVFSQECSATKLCATGCCSTFGFCGTDAAHCGSGNCVSTCGFKLGCDASNPCAAGTGCCSKFGFCGLGPDYCGADVCVAGCDSKSYCDPGYGSSSFSEVEKCPLNVCCSKWGFCGLTEEFCGNKTVTRPPSCSGISRVVGYYEGWSQERPCHTFFPEQIPLGVYTHVNFAFASIDPTTFRVIPSAPDDELLYRRLTDLKQFDPDLKVYIAIGGWTFNNPGKSTATTFSDIAGSEVNQRAFAASLISFMSTYNFDGVDLDWEYPGADDRAGRPADFVNFPKFIANLKSALDTNSPGRNGLTITIPTSYWYLQHFDIVELVKYVDWFNIMTYDLHGTWDKGNKWLGNFLNAHTNLTEITTSLDLLWRNNIKSDKVVLGMAFYARAFTVTSTSCMTPGCTFESGALKGPCSQETSVLLNSELVDIANARKISPVLYKDAAVKVMMWDDQWAAFDDQDTFQLKADFARSQCLGGVMVWAISHDTQDGVFTKALGKAVNRNFIALADTSGSTTTTTESKTQHKQCKWTDCGGSCPNGMQRMIRYGDGTRTNENKHVWEYMVDESGCDGIGTHQLCCPLDENSELPVCEWQGFNNGGGKCSSKCKTGYVEVGSNSKYCDSKKSYDKYEVACCTTGKPATLLWEKANWGSKGCTYIEPDCAFGQQILALSSSGNGGAMCPKQTTYNGVDVFKSRNYCMNTLDTHRAFGNCDVGAGSRIMPKGRDSTKFCYASCPENKVRITLDSQNYGCNTNGGAQTICCDDNYIDVTTTTTTTINTDPQVLIWQKAWVQWKASGTASDCSAASFAKRSFSTHGENFSDPHTYDFDLDTQGQNFEPILAREVAPRDILVEMVWIAMVSSNSLPKTIMAKSTWDADATEMGYSALLSDSLRSYWEKYGLSLQITPLTFVKKMFCNLAAYNKTVGNPTRTMTCNPFILYNWDGTLQFDDETHESIYSISKSPPTRRALGIETEDEPDSKVYGNILEKRAGGGTREYNIILYDFAGNPYTITITSATYPNGANGDTLQRLTGSSARFWVGNGDGNCNSAVVQTDASQAQIDLWAWVTEHILELQLIARFLTLLVNGRVATRAGLPDIVLPPGIDRVAVDTIQRFFQKPWNTWTRLASTNTPEQDIFQAMGSVKNPSHLVVAESTMNSYKGRGFKFDDFVAADTWNEMTGQKYSETTPIEGYRRVDAEAALTSIQTAIGIFDYLNQPAIANALRSTYLGVQAVWVLFQQQLALSPQLNHQIDMVWQYFMQQYFRAVFDFTRNWATGRIRDLRQQWQAVIDLSNGGLHVSAEDLDVAHGVIEELDVLATELAGLTWTDASFR